MNRLNSTYWNDRYQRGDTPWDIGDVSKPLKAYIDGLANKQLRVLIPGAGRAYEAAYLHQQGFEQVYVCDWAEDAFQLLRTQVPDFPTEHQLVQNFFELDLTVDLILEQTFFAAIRPEQRPDYARKAAELLAPKGRLAGVLFAQPFPTEGPPFGGTAEEYRTYFEPHFAVLQMDISENSIKPRAGKELFIELQKR